MKEVHPLLDKEKQEKAKVYEWIGRKIGLWGMLVSAVFNLIFYFSGLSSKIANWNFNSSAVIIFIIYMLIYGSIQDIIELPFS
jgi:high-affinity Fe2+/Pb2+ permease